MKLKTLPPVDFVTKIYHNKSFTWFWLHWSKDKITNMALYFFHFSTFGLQFRVQTFDVKLLDPNWGWGAETPGTSWAWSMCLFLRWRTNCAQRYANRNSTCSAWPSWWSNEIANFLSIEPFLQISKRKLRKRSKVAQLRPFFFWDITTIFLIFDSDKVETNGQRHWIRSNKSNKANPMPLSVCLYLIWVKS